MDADSGSGSVLGPEGSSSGIGAAGGVEGEGGILELNYLLMDFKEVNKVEKLGRHMAGFGLVVVVVVVNK